MPRVTVLHWNPRQGPVPGRLGYRLPVGSRPNNFGDLLGPIIVRLMCERLGLIFGRGPHRRRMLAVGSVMHHARSGDVIWGTGVNGRVDPAEYRGHLRNVDVRGVRGPLTADFLRTRGITVPDVYGDPALLLSQFFSRSELADGHRRRAVSIVPNLNDYNYFDLGSPDIILPTEPVMQCLGKIAASDMVVGSSLHGIIVAEAFGIPARLVSSRTESDFKYEDYYRGTGRKGFAPAASVEEAIEKAGEPPISWDPAPLMNAFPRELFVVGSSVTK